MKNRDDIQKTAEEAIGNLNRCGIAASMGSGKTLIGLKHMVKNYSEYARFLVVAPKTSILKEWLQQAEQHKLSYLIPHIHITTYLSLSKQDLDFDVVYLDECHSLLYSHESWLDCYKGKILGLTGTPPKYKASEKGEMVDRYCPIVYKYKTDTAINDKILNDYKIVVHTLPLNRLKTIEMKTKQGKTWYASEYDTYNYWTNRLDAASTKKEQQIMRVMRMKALMGFPSKEQFAKKLLDLATDKTILFANTQDQADRLCTHSYHSNNSYSEDNLIKFKTGEITKLSCVLQLNEGVNIPDLKEGIIMHAYGNERKTSQRLGRLLRLNPNDTSTINVLCYKDTVDETWVEQALEDFDQTKITYL
jgi:superfamily II DNA or RNA helicase